MSAGKSEVVRFEPRDCCSDYGMRGSSAGEYVLLTDYAALESLLLDARAEVRDVTLLLKETRKFLSYIHPAESELLGRIDLKFGNVGFDDIDAQENERG